MIYNFFKYIGWMVTGAPEDIEKESREHARSSFWAGVVISVLVTILMFSFR